MLIADYWRVSANAGIRQLLRAQEGRTVGLSNLALYNSLQINRMDYAEINVDHKFHRHLIGKNGANSKWCAFLIFAMLGLSVFCR